MTRISIEFNHNLKTQWLVHFTTEWKWRPKWKVFYTDHHFMRYICFGFIEFETTATRKDKEEYYG